MQREEEKCWERVMRMVGGSSIWQSHELSIIPANSVITFLSAMHIYIIKRGLYLPGVTQCWWLCWAEQRQTGLQQIQY